MLGGALIKEGLKRTAETVCTALAIYWGQKLIDRAFSSGQEDGDDDVEEDNDECGESDEQDQSHT